MRLHHLIDSFSCCCEGAELRFFTLTQACPVLNPVQPSSARQAKKAKGKGLRLKAKEQNLGAAVWIAYGQQPLLAHGISC